MKTSVQIQLCVLIVEESFGEVLSKVTRTLLICNKIPLRELVFRTKLRTKQVKQALAIGIQHNFIKPFRHPKGHVYGADTNAIIARLRFPFFVYYTKILYGHIAQALIEELVHHGQLSHTTLIEGTVSRLNKVLKENTYASDVEAKLDALLKSRFAEQIEDDDPQPSVVEAPPSKRIRLENEHNTKYYRICYQRYDLYQRDQLITSAVSHRLGAKHGEIISTMLRLSETRTNPSNLEGVPLTGNEIFDSLPKELGVTSKTLLDVYLVTLVEDEMGVVMKVGDSGGGSYCINFSKVLTALCKSNMESLVLERFGSKSLRIFRLLLLRNHLEQKQLEEMVMIPAKTVKELLYEMLTQNFVASTEVAKTADHAPSRTFYCFKVPVEQLARQLLEWNWKSLFNLMTKRQLIMRESRRLLDKQQRVEAIIASMTGVDDEQKQEVEEMITPAERNQLHTVKLQTRK